MSINTRYYLKTKIYSLCHVMLHIFTKSVITHQKLTIMLNVIKTIIIVVVVTAVCAVIMNAAGNMAHSTFANIQQ